MSESAQTDAVTLATGMTLWCAGLPYTGNRALTPAEQAELACEIDRLRISGRWLFSSILPTAIILACFTPSIFHDASDRHITFELILSRFTQLSGVTLCALAIAVEAWLGCRFLRQQHQFEQDFEAGSVDVYQGMLTERTRLEATQQTLLTSHLLSIDPNCVQTIEILSRSNYLWRVNSVRLRRIIHPSLTEVAETPPFASIAAQWLQEVGRHETEVLYGGQRELSDNEKRELRRFIRRLVVRVASSSLPVAALSLALATEVYHSQAIESDPVFWVFVAGGVMNVVLYVYQIRQARRLSDDLRIGYVGIRRVGKTGASADAKAEPDIEFLPVTGLLWTRSGEPAVWRRGSA